MSNKIKFILYTAGLLLLASAITYSIDQLYKKRAHQKFVRIFKHNIDKEVMIFGSSVAYHHFDPGIIDSITHLPTYNMGWDGMFFVQYEALIKEYLTYQQQCKVIVMACDFDNLGKNELITRPDLMYAYLGNPYVYASLHEIEPRKIVLAKYIPGYKLTLLNKTFYNSILFSNPNEGRGNGFDPVTDSFRVKSDTAFHARFDEHIYSNLKNTIANINARGIKVVIVMTPVYKDGYSLILNADDIKNKYKVLVDNKNVFFLDYTTVPELDSVKSYFYNYSHMNALGARIFSNLFA